MAESNPTQVILTDDGLKIIKAQSTADSAASQAENANSALSIAKSTANAAKSAADSTYDYANSEMAVQSNATAKAQSKADSAFSQAVEAIDTGNVTSQAVTALKDGSTMTIAQLQNGLETKISNSDYASYKDQTASQIAQMVTNGAFSAYSQATADLISSKVATSDFSSYKDQTATAIDSKVASSAFDSFKEQTASAISSKVSTADFSTYKTQTADDINLRVTKKGLIDEINLQAGNTLISSSGQLTLSGKTIYFDTVNPVIIPSANITGTLNGKTINAGDVISNANNTANYYPMTITPDGAYKSTYFDSAVGLQSSVESGAISYKYRSMIGSGTYSYDNVAIDGQGITLDSGTTTTKDTTFSAAETETAYISLTKEAGLYLHGSNANIDFGGHLSDDSTSVGMYMNPYGNLIAKSASQYWQISVAGTDNTGGGVVARFGIDSASAYNIIFNRELDVGNFHINTGHTFASADGGDIHFAKGGGGAANIYAGDVHYNSLVKSSLLSVKKDVKKADTSYWAQLVNSISLATYQYKSDDNTSHLRLSSIVDDVNDTKQWQLPDVFISRDEDGKLNGVDDSVLLNATLATVQEQQKEIDQLNGHLLELEAKLNG
ncbi:hypothetical protein [Lactiplantibacillus plantarum]|uniref:hypothetical protein n=1 Tax=Lactiplantibacillus plantarum TaxID=1590 RepID=UPI002F25F590